MTVASEYEIALPDGALSFSVSSATHLGMVRAVNEDSFLASPGLVVVADGMGGHSFGDRASQCVVESFRQSTKEHTNLTPEIIVQAITDANTALLTVNSGDESVSGTTLTGIALVSSGVDAEPRWMTFNAGDSRVYSWDGRHLEQVTVDHSAVQELLDLGHISQLEAASHPQRNVVTRALGIRDNVEPEYWLLPIGANQVFVACSDGLTKELDDDLIAAILADRSALGANQSIAERLVAAALAAGGSDNVTVVVVETHRIGVAGSIDEDTLDRGVSEDLEQTRPRK